MQNQTRTTRTTRTTCTTCTTRTTNTHNTNTIKRENPCKVDETTMRSKDYVSPPTAYAWTLRAQRRDVRTRGAIEKRERMTGTREKRV
jgi:hypothetical protein